MAAPLAGLAVLVTRPHHQAAGLCRALTEVGATAVPLPTLEIRAETGPALEAAVVAAARADWLIFVSANAVDHGLPALWAAGMDEAVRLVAVGPATAAALRRHGATPALTPASGFDSEALLALAPLQDVSGRRVVIVRGVGGRELLGETLRRRGAEVSYIEVYRRVRPALDPEPALRRWAVAPRRAVVVTSGAGLSNLLAMVPRGRRGALLTATLVTVSPRLEEAGAAAGFRGPRLVCGPGDNQIVERLIASLGNDKE